MYMDMVIVDNFCPVTDILLFGLSQGKPEQASCLRRITSANTPTHGISHRVLGRTRGYGRMHSREGERYARLV